MIGSTDDAVERGHIAFERRGALGHVRLNRPDALNAVTHAMVHALRAALDEWAADDGLRAVAISGEGRAFSAGGDIREIYQRGLDGEPYDAFFADEYALNIAIHRFPKPYVALVNGIAMGGGVGVGYHGSHLVVGEGARFAMPECSIGFFPDVGATHLLSRLPEDLGERLGLTGARLDADAQLRAGLATHGLDSEAHEALLNALAEGQGPDAALVSLGARVASVDGDGVVDGDAEPVGSPTSHAVTRRQISLGRGLSFEQCMGVEARIAYRMLRRPDFYEGIRAVVIDKDRSPRWQPADQSGVSADEVASHFDPVPDGPLEALSKLAPSLADLP